MVFKEIIAVYSENNTKPINACEQNTKLLAVKAGVTHSYHRDLKFLDINLKIYAHNSPSHLHLH